MRLSHDVRSALVLWWITLMVILPGASAWAATAQRKGPPPPREFVIDLPVSMDDRTVGSMSVVLTGTSLTAVEAASWEEFGPQHFSPEMVQRIAGGAVGGRIPVASFTEADLGISYDPARLLIFLRPKGEQRAIESLSVQQRPGGLRSASASDEGSFATYVNLRALREFATGAQSDASHGPLRVSLDGAARFFGPRGAALEWSAFYEGQAENNWSRGEVRLIHDDPARAIRYSFGDVNFQTADFQGAVPLLGFSAERRFSALQPSSVVTSTGQQTFILSRPSRVTIYVNGVFLRVFQLQPGRYSLSDFAAADGANEVLIEIEDNTGQKEVIEFTLFLDATLLAPGVSEFSVNGGVRRKADAAQSIEYARDRPAWSGFVRYGLTEFATLGANYQGERGIDVFGLEGVAASPIGNFSGAVSVSRRDGFDAGHAATARWSYNIGKGPEGRLRRIDLSTIYTNEDYAPLGVEQPSNRFSWQTQLRLTTPLPFGFLGALSGRQARSRERQTPDETRVGILLTRRFGRVATSFSIERTTGSEKEIRGFFTLSLPLGRSQGVSASWQSQNNQRRLEWAKYPTSRVGSVGARLGVETSDLGRSATANLVYTGNRFIAQARHDIAQAGLNDDEAVQRTNVQIETALAFAGGRLALGRPIGDAFAIVSRHSSLKGTDILVAPSSDGPLAVADGLGPAVVPTLTSYRPQEVAWDAQRLPTGYDLGNTRREVAPAYRSGLSFQAGSAASITVVGVARHADGSPLSLVAAEIRAEDGRDFRPAKTFTNRSGRFAAQALEPGSYSITFAGDKPRILRFRVNDAATNFIDLGSMPVKED